MGRTSTQRQRSSVPPIQNAEVPPPITIEDNRPSAPDPETRLPASLQAEPGRSTVTEDDLRRRAYEIYLKRGDNPGDHLDDWLQAERELLAD